VRNADNLPPYCAVVTKSGSLNFSEPPGPVQACYEAVFYFTTYEWDHSFQQLVGSQIGHELKIWCKVEYRAPSSRLRGIQVNSQYSGIAATLGGWVASKPIFWGPSLSMPSFFHLQNNWNRCSNNSRCDKERSVCTVLKCSSKLNLNGIFIVVLIHIFIRKYWLELWLIVSGMVVSHGMVFLGFRHAVSFSLSVDSNIVCKFPLCNIFPQF